MVSRNHFCSCLLMVVNKDLCAVVSVMQLSQFSDIGYVCCEAGIYPMTIQASLCAIGCMLHWGLSNGLPIR